MEEKKIGKENEENYWRRKMCFFAEEKNSSDGKGGNIWRMKIYFLRRKTGKEKMANIWKCKIYFLQR